MPAVVEEESVRQNIDANSGLTPDISLMAALFVCNKHTALGRYAAADEYLFHVEVYRVLNKVTAVMTCRCIFAKYGEKETGMSPADGRLCVALPILR